MKVKLHRKSYSLATGKMAEAETVVRANCVSEPTRNTCLYKHLVYGPSWLHRNREKELRLFHRSHNGFKLSKAAFSKAGGCRKPRSPNLPRTSLIFHTALSIYEASIESTLPRVPRKRNIYSPSLFEIATPFPRPPPTFRGGNHFAESRHDRFAD